MWHKYVIYAMPSKSHFEGIGPISRRGSAAILPHLWFMLSQESKYVAEITPVHRCHG